MRSGAVNWEKRERFLNYDGPVSTHTTGTISGANMVPLSMVLQHRSSFVSVNLFFV